MRKLITMALLMTLPSAGFCVGVFFENNMGNARNGRIILVTTTPTLVNQVNSQSKTMTALNDDMENTIYYGDSTCGVNTAQKIQPMEKAVFNGVTSGFAMYVCTASGSAELRLVENP